MMITEQQRRIDELETTIANCITVMQSARPLVETGDPKAFYFIGVLANAVRVIYGDRPHGAPSIPNGKEPK